MDVQTEDESWERPTPPVSGNSSCASHPPDGLQVCLVAARVRAGCICIPDDGAGQHEARGTLDLRAGGVEHTTGQRTGQLSHSISTLRADIQPEARLHADAGPCHASP